MGEHAEMMLDGTCCACCGEYLGGGGWGIPTYCKSCEPDFIQRVAKPKRSAKISCDICGKRVKSTGLLDHKRDAHGISAGTKP